ncbi:MAG TPA: type 4a pilus biogenesis protein PilO [Candidatus Angelobacter sp.]|nr:type 4a pilus biogenesis protein PilO [Candidatus Angelobacter sp.]
MAKFDEMSLIVKVGILALVAGIVGAGFYFWPLGPMNDEIKDLRAQVAAKRQENEMLKSYVPKLADLNKQIAQLQEQLAEEKKIVPDEKEADLFIKQLHDTAAAAGIEIRRYTAMPIANHDFYTEVPFQLDLDGSYFSMLNFFDRIGKVERIITIGNLQVSNTKATGPSKVKTTYPYAPGESVVASCTATTFFSHDLVPPEAAAPVKK